MCHWLLYFLSIIAFECLLIAVSCFGHTVQPCSMFTDLKFFFFFFSFLYYNGCYLIMDRDMKLNFWSLEFCVKFSFCLQKTNLNSVQFQNVNGVDLQQCESRQNEHTDLSSASYVSSMEVCLNFLILLSLRNENFLGDWLKARNLCQFR